MAKRQVPTLEIVEEGKVPVATESPVEEKVGVSFQESLTISWIFSIFHATYILIGITMGLNSNQWNENEWSSLVDGNSFGLTAYSIFSILLNVVLFPLFFWLYGRFWINILRVFSNIFEKIEDEDELNERCEEVVANSFTSYTYLVIPIIGDFLHKLTFLVYLYAGLRRNLKLNLLQSVLILLCPLLLILLLFFLMLMSIGLLFATL